MEIDTTSPIRTFTAATLREALAMVKRELGPDALILKQQRVGHRVAVQASSEMPAAESLVEVADIQVLEAPPFGSKHYRNLERQEGEVTEARPTRVADLAYRQVDISNLFGSYRFVGASGVGKTTTVIKLMVEWVMHNGNCGIKVISTDDQRLAGTESLQLACQMLDVPLEEISLKDLNNQRGLFRERELVLIDTPAWETYAQLCPVAEIQDIWVFSAMHSHISLQAQWQSLPQRALSGLSVTHLDQSVDGDSLLQQMLKWGKPLYWLGTGAQLPGGIDAASSNLLAQYLYGIDRSQSTTIVV
ncbi:MAG: hypothetical protein GXP16_04145 [Gammaproteobacteria bacterium]|nr:hypothetical protein [Gammaproteobacteria bacterium]